MTQTPFESKSASEVGADFADFMVAFEEFKATNEIRLAEIASKAAPDVLTTEKLDRLNARMEELQLRQARPPIGGGESTRASARDLQHKSAFASYVRNGDAGALRTIETKALAAGVATDGGYLVPVETESVVNSALRSISPIRAISSVRQVSSTVFKKPFATTGFQVGWVAETAARPQTTTPTLSEIAFPTMELYAMPAATPALLEDSAVDIDAWLAEEVRLAFAQQEGTAFISGNGTDKPRGFLAYPTVANASWSWGNIGFVTSGAAAGFPASNPTDRLIDLVYALKAPYRANAHFVMSRATQAAIRKFKDADGNYIWQPAQRAGDAPMLLGHPVVESEDMPTIAADALAIAFGDFRRGYLVVDRVGIRVLRDPYSAKPYVLFYTTKRVGGGVQDFDAIKVMKVAV